MGAKSITNPNGAFGYSAEVERTVTPYKTSAAITGKKVVAVGTDKTVATAATDSTAALSIGVSTESAALGDTVMVVTHGIIDDVPVDGAVTAGATLKRSVTTAGSLAATASPATGEVVGFAIAASASNLASVYVLK